MSADWETGTLPKGNRYFNRGLLYKKRLFLENKVKIDIYGQISNKNNKKIIDLMVSAGLKGIIRIHSLVFGVDKENLFFGERCFL